MLLEVGPGNYIVDLLVVFAFFKKNEKLIFQMKKIYLHRQIDFQEFLDAGSDIISFLPYLSRQKKKKLF